MFRNIPRGFTLTELIIAVAIIGILAAIAYPAYTSQLQKTRRAECRSALMQIAGAMEADFSRNNNQYRDILNTVPPRFPGTCPIDGTGAPTYTLNIPVLTASTYTLTATPIAGTAQTNDRCGTLTLTNLLLKGQGSGATLEQCWQ
ncbi:MAG: type IV pilin protein [Gammaproteobacteria bacterium]|nr:MAG: type IV pilin protein [Gammaproteobacteria bacterium]